MDNKNKKKMYPKLTTCAYSFATLISANLDTEELLQFAVFLNTAADLIILNAEERKNCEEKTSLTNLTTQAVASEIITQNEEDALLSNE